MKNISKETTQTLSKGAELLNIISALFQITLKPQLYPTNVFWRKNSNSELWTMLVLLCEVMQSKPSRVINYLIAKEYDRVTGIALLNIGNVKSLEDLRRLTNDNKD